MGPQAEFESTLGSITWFLRASVPSLMNGALTGPQGLLPGSLALAQGLAEKREVWQRRIGLFLTTSPLPGVGRVRVGTFVTPPGAGPSPRLDNCGVWKELYSLQSGFLVPPEAGGSPDHP